MEDTVVGSSRRTWLVRPTDEVLEARLERSDFDAELLVEGRVRTVHFPLTWPGDALPLVENWRSLGFAKESLTTLLDVLARHDVVRRVVAETHLDNRASQRVLAACGFEHIGTFETGEGRMLWWGRSLPGTSIRRPGRSERVP